MAITFPANPSLNDTYTVNSVVYTWDGTKWNASTGFVSYSYADKIQEGDSSAEVVDNGGDAYFAVTNNAVEKFRVNVDGQLSTPYAGNASSPALYVGGDINSGLYSPGADQLALATNGTGRLFVDASGNISIGGSTKGVFGNQTLAVGQPVTGVAGGLTVYSDATQKGYIAFGRGTTGTSSYRGLLEYDQPNDYLSIYTAASERLRITSTGLVGIGTDSPLSDAKLTIGDDDAPAIAFQRTGAGKFESAIGMNGNSSLRFYVGADSSSIAGLNEAMQITATGLVGIGTQSPSAALQVGDGSSGGLNAVVKFNTYNANTSALKLSNWNGSTTSYGPKITFDNSGRGTYVLGSGDGVNDFYLGNGTSRFLTVDSSGRLLVGTASVSGTPKMVVRGVQYGNRGIDVDGPVYAALVKSYLASAGSVTIGTVVKSDEFYILHVWLTLTANTAATPGMYYISKKGTAEQITTVKAAQNCTISFNASDQVVITTSTAGYLYANMQALIN